MFKVLVSVLISIAVGFIAGLFVYRFLIGPNIPAVTKQGGIIDTIQGNPIFTTQSATIDGQVTEIGDRKLTVKNSSGTTGTFRVADNFVIVNIGKTGKDSSPSADLKRVPVGEKAIIELRGEGGELVIFRVATNPLPIEVGSPPPFKFDPKSYPSPK